MKALRTYNVETCESDALQNGDFNAGEHLHVEIEPGKNQTISCLLPNGKFVTFAFLPSRKGENEMECVDIHTTVGKPFLRDPEREEGALAYPQQLIGFCYGSDMFDTRRFSKHTTLATLLLHKNHYNKPPTKTEVEDFVNTFIQE
jgi:hypothetical protein